MFSAEFVHEFRAAWLPNVEDSGLARLIDLLKKGSPLLLTGRFSAAPATGCLATHIGWHHPAVRHRMDDAGILWLTRIARLNPATSHVIQEWDQHDAREWGVRQQLLALLLSERDRRSFESSPKCERQPIAV
jgi:hypothetical protein